LSQGAKLVVDVDDVLEEVGALCMAAVGGGPGSESAARPPPSARAVWEQLGYEPLSIDELVSLGAGDASSVIAALQLLELEGLVEQRNGSFMRCL
jgi:DNA processing protein